MEALDIVRCFIFCILVFKSAFAISPSQLYDYDVREAIQLPPGDDVSTHEVRLKVPIIFYGTAFDSLFVNNNGIISFQTEIPTFFNIEFPLDYPIISPFYSNVDTSNAGQVTYYETDRADLLQRATEEIHEAFINNGDFQATSVFIVTWSGVGYHKEKNDKTNSFQVVIISDGADTFVEFLYPENGLQWIQSEGDNSGLPDARAQAGFVSPDGRVFSLPGSGQEHVRELDRLSNVENMGQWIYKVDNNKIEEPDQYSSEKPKETITTCSEATTYCHIEAQCTDYEGGICCKCREGYYGNGKSCIKNDAPLRVNGKISGKINEEIFESLDLQSYVVMVDARAYTAISKIPEAIGYSIQSLQILGSVIGYIFAKPVRDAQNGYQLTGGVFNHTAVIRFLNTSQTCVVKQKYLGLDVFDQLKLEANIQGEVPILPEESKVEFDSFVEDYALTSPGTVQISSTRSFKVHNINGVETTYVFQIDQTIMFDYCKFDRSDSGLKNWKVEGGKNFISYEGREQIVRFGLSNRISPIGDFDPCEEGRSQCGQNSVCVVENDSYKCICSVGYQKVWSQEGEICGDVDECQTGLSDCDYNAQCFNQLGNYSCTCNPGFEGDGKICTNSASCANVQCNEDAKCVEENGIAACRCLPGFYGDGLRCAPSVDTSCHQANNCSPYGYCQIDQREQRYKCYCLPGFEGDGYRCDPIPRTTQQPVNEGESTEPVPTTDRVPKSCLDDHCWCPQGFLFDEDKNNCYYAGGNGTQTGGQVPPVGTSCNELRNCHRDAQCVLNVDTYQCVCHNGFEGDGYRCERQKPDCLQETTSCNRYAMCTFDEQLRKSVCKCNHGYEGDGYSCTLAICTSNSDCSPTEECMYAQDKGRYECICKEGFGRDTQNQCVDNIDSCGGGTCVENAECLYDNTYETHYCSCKEGFTGDGISECKEEVHTCEVLNNCGAHATCTFDDASAAYVCKCSEGFEGDGYTCRQERNCQNTPSLCDRYAICTTDYNRKFICQCNAGYIGNGTHCRQRPPPEGNFLLLNQGMATLKIPLQEYDRVKKPIVQITPGQTAVGLDVDCLEGRLYWSDVAGKAIRSAYYDGTDKKDFIKEDLGTPESLAIDWVSRNIYWTDPSRRTIEVASLGDNPRRRVLFDTNLLNPRGIAVHPQRGKIFWTDWNRQSPKIEWANADGTDRQIFVQLSKNSLPNSVVIDYEQESLCYAVAGAQKIECVQIDSRQSTTQATNCTYPFGIAVTSDNIFWSDWVSRKIERVEKYSLKRLPPLDLPAGVTGGGLYEIAAVPQRCRNLVNVCQYNRESCPPEHICLPTGHGTRKCVCSKNAKSPFDKPTCNL